MLHFGKWIDWSGWVQTDKRINWQPIINIYCLFCVFSANHFIIIIVPALVIVQFNENAIEIPFFCCCYVQTTHLELTL